jgi:hypothetical protein
MKISKQDLLFFQPTPNHVLVRSVVSMNTVTVGGQQILIDTSYKPEHHQEVICEVIKAPKKLIFDRTKPSGESMEWLTTMDLKTGEIVWCNYLSVLKGKENLEIECEGVKYFIINYQQIYLKKVKQRVEMLNGYVLCEPVYVEDLKDKILISKMIDVQRLKKFDEYEGVARETQYGIVRYLGKPVEEYHNANAVPDDDYLRVGDMVMFTTPNNVRLEHNLHRHFNGEDMIVSRRNRILGIIQL